MQTYCTSFLKWETPFFTFLSFSVTNWQYVLFTNRYLLDGRPFTGLDIFVGGPDYVNGDGYGEDDNFADFSLADSLIVPYTNPPPQPTYDPYFYQHQYNYHHYHTSTTPATTPPPETEQLPYFTLPTEDPYNYNYINPVPPPVSRPQIYGTLRSDVTEWMSRSAVAYRRKLLVVFRGWCRWLAERFFCCFSGDISVSLRFVMSSALIIFVSVFYVFVAWI